MPRHRHTHTHAYTECEWVSDMGVIERQTDRWTGWLCVWRTLANVNSISDRKWNSSQELLDPMSLTALLPPHCLSLCLFYPLCMQWKCPRAQLAVVLQVKCPIQLTCADILLARICQSSLSPLSSPHSPLPTLLSPFRAVQKKEFLANDRRAVLLFEHKYNGNSRIHCQLRSR